MSFFGHMKTEGLEQAQDRLGGFSLFETKIYSGKIKVAYAGKSDNGALNVTVVADLDGREYKETIYVSNRKGENFFLNKDDQSKKVPLPGFTIINDMCLIAAGCALADAELEEKVVKIWDSEAKKEMPTAVQALVGLTDQPISLGIIKSTEFKQKKNDQTGEYEPTTETRDTNNIDKVYHTETKMTVLEAQQGKEKGEFWDAWSAKNDGQTRDKTKGAAKNGGTAGAPGSKAPPAQGAAAGGTTPRKSLFGK